MAALHPSIADLNLAIVGVRFFGLLRGVARYTERLTSHDVTFRLLARLRTWFYERLEPLAPAHLAGFRLADLVDRILADVEALEHFYVRALSPPLVALVILPASALFLGAYAPGLGWVHLGFGLLLGFFLPLLTLALGKRPGQDYSRRRAALRIGALDLVQGLADLLANGRGTDFLERLKQQGEVLGRAQARMARLTGISSAAGVLIANLGMWTVLVLSIPLVRAGRMDGVMLAVLALMAYASFEALLPLPHAAQLLAANLASARRLYEIVAPPSTEEGAGQPPAGMLAALPPRPALQVRALTFTYPGSAAPALRGLTFDLPPGGKLGIVGPSGAGKSTLLHLLLGFRPAPEGSILMDGHAQQEMTGETLRRAFSVISQHTHLFNASLRENLLLGDPDADQVQLEQAARLAGIHDFICSLPRGYETQAGERGLRFSAGERQRLAIARALLRPAPILLLDEPVASLDALAARSILENLFNLAGDRSLLIITHRLAGLEALDEILVLEDGLLVERGSHAALMRTAGLYRRMVNLQRRILDETGSGA
jgi:thiol reductant ABC exporter CydC subunit